MTIPLAGERAGFAEAIHTLQSAQNYLAHALRQLEVVQARTTEVIGHNTYADDVADVVTSIKAIQEKLPGFEDDLRDHLNDLDEDEEGETDDS